MFNQQEYINNYIKETYKTVKIRVRNDNKVIINKLANVDNINKYIIDLITKDIYENRVYNYINNDIEFDFELPNKLQYLVDDAEEADLLGDYGLYMNLADMIDSEAKKNVTHHIITEGQWIRLQRRYQL